MGETSKIAIVGAKVSSRFAPGTVHFGLLETRRKGCNDPLRDLVLQLEYIFEGAIEAIRPNVCTRDCVDQLTGNPQSATGLTHTAFEHIPHTEFSAHLSHIGRLSLVGK